MSKVQKSARAAVAAATIVVSLFGMAGVASAAGKPAVGTVGKADGKTPAGQSVDDHNKGYTCDGNKGVGQGNPAHAHNCGTVTNPIVVVVL